MNTRPCKLDFLTAAKVLPGYPVAPEKLPIRFTYGDTTCYGLRTPTS